MRYVNRLQDIVGQSVKSPLNRVSARTWLQKHDFLTPRGTLGRYGWNVHSHIVQSFKQSLSIRYPCDLVLVHAAHSAMDLDQLYEDVFGKEEDTLKNPLSPLEKYSKHSKHSRVSQISDVANQDQNQYKLQGVGMLQGGRALVGWMTLAEQVDLLDMWVNDWKEWLIEWAIQIGVDPYSLSTDANAVKIGEKPFARVFTRDHPSHKKDKMLQDAKPSLRRLPIVVDVSLDKLALEYLCGCVVSDTFVEHQDLEATKHTRIFPLLDYVLCPQALTCLPLFANEEILIEKTEKVVELLRSVRAWGEPPVGIDLGNPHLSVQSRLAAQDERGTMLNAVVDFATLDHDWLLLRRRDDRVAWRCKVEDLVLAYKEKRLLHDIIRKPVDGFIHPTV